MQGEPLKWRRTDGCKHCVSWWFLTRLYVFLFSRVLLWSGGKDGRRGRANLLWRRGCESERTEAIAERQTVSIQSSQRRECSVPLSTHISVSIHPSATVSSAESLMSVFLKRCHQARYGSLKIKGKKRPALSAVNYGVWRHYCCHIHTHSWAGCWLVDGTVSLFLALTFHSAELFDNHLSADIFITRSGSKSARSQRTRADFVVGRVICFFLR